MPLTKEEIQEIAESTAQRVMHELKELSEEVHERDMYMGILIGEGAIPLNGREKRKAPCRACRIDPDKPLEAGNIMATTEGAIGTLSKPEIRDWCSEIVEVMDGRCERARQVRNALIGTRSRTPQEMQEILTREIRQL